MAMLIDEPVEFAGVDTRNAIAEMADKSKTSGDDNISHKVDNTTSIWRQRELRKALVELERTTKSRRDNQVSCLINRTPQFTSEHRSATIAKRMRMVIDRRYDDLAISINESGFVLGSAPTLSNEDRHHAS